MRYPLLGLLLSSCVVGVDGVPPPLDPCGQDTVCAAAEQVAGEYCSRHETCFGEYDPYCRSDMFDSVCSMYDCAAYYPEAIRWRLQSCLDYRDRQACWGPEPPECPIY